MKEGSGQAFVPASEEEVAVVAEERGFGVVHEGLD